MRQPSTLEASTQSELEQKASEGKSHIFAVLTLALLLRLLVLCIVLHYPSGWLYTRGTEMGLLAKSLLAGQGLSSPFGEPTGPTAFIAPAYPIFVAGIFSLFGTYTIASAVVIISVQILLNLLTVFLIMKAASQIFDPCTANIASLFFGCSLPLLWLPTIFWETSISTCLIAGWLLIAISFTRQKLGRLAWAGVGIYCGFAALVNLALLPALIAVFAWIAFRTWKIARLAPVVGFVTFALVFSAWPIRNARAFHAFIPMRTTVGFELWMGNRPGASGFLEESLFPTFNILELEEYKSMGEVAYTNNKSRLAVQYVEAHPKEFLRMTVTRIVRFWTGTGTKDGSPIFYLHAIVTTTLGFWGLWKLIKWRSPLAFSFILPLLIFPIPTI